MNPHFIFNALNSIQDFIMLSEKENAQLYLGKFARLMRGFLEASSQESICLADEIPLLESYIELEGLRFDEDFSYEITYSDNLTEEALEDISVPPLLVQPYLENAFKHGLFHKKGKKTLRLSFDKTDNTIDALLKITITDNGIGRQKSAEINSKKEKPHQSFATKATEERLALIKQQSSTHQPIEININDLTNSENQAIGTAVVMLIRIQ
jgi:LytS/YehU family sensor histidine kinase